MGRRRYGVGLDFDNPELYRIIEQEATKGKSNNGIAVYLAKYFDLDISPETFENMIEGHYEAWSSREAHIYPFKLKRAIRRGKVAARQAVRSALLKSAIGGRVIKSTTTRTRKLRIGGVLTEDEEIETVTNETELAPNVTAIMQWLHHNDPDWRKQDQNRAPEDMEDIAPDGVPQDIEHGIDIHKWIDEQVL